MQAASVEQHGTVSSADRLSQGVIVSMWPQVRRIPMKTSEKSRKKAQKNRRLRRAIGPHLPPAWIPSRAPAPPQSHAWRFMDRGTSLPEPVPPRPPTTSHHF